jgi:hypothetical protein
MSLGAVARSSLPNTGSASRLSRGGLGCTIIAPSDSRASPAPPSDAFVTSDVVESSPPVAGSAFPTSCPARSVSFQASYVRHEGDRQGFNKYYNGKNPDPNLLHGAMVDGPTPTTDSSTTAPTTGQSVEPTVSGNAPICGVFARLASEPDGGHDDGSASPPAYAPPHKGSPPAGVGDQLVDVRAGHHLPAETASSPIRAHLRPVQHARQGHVRVPLLASSSPSSTSWAAKISVVGQLRDCLRVMMQAARRSFLFLFSVHLYCPFLQLNLCVCV